MINEANWDLLKLIHAEDEKIKQAEQLAQQDREALADYEKIEKSRTRKEYVESH